MQAEENLPGFFGLFAAVTVSADSVFPALQGAAGNGAGCCLGQALSASQALLLSSSLLLYRMGWREKREEKVFKLTSSFFNFKSLQIPALWIYMAYEQRVLPSGTKALNTGDKSGFIPSRMNPAAGLAPRGTSESQDGDRPPGKNGEENPSPSKEEQLAALQLWYFCALWASPPSFPSSGRGREELQGCAGVALQSDNGGGKGKGEMLKVVQRCETLPKTHLAQEKEGDLKEFSLEQRKLWGDPTAASQC